MTSAPQRVFLGWDQLPLPAAATWIARELGPDLSNVLVALPAARAGRRLLELLTLDLGRELRPPRIVTAGALSDELLQVDGAPAGRLARTMAWARALRDMDGARLRHLVARPPDMDDLAGWFRLAEEVRGLFGEVAAEGLDFADVAQDELLANQVGERRRWEALALAQKSMQQQLAAAELCDPHLGRLDAIEHGRVTPVAHVVLVGVVEINELLRRALELTGARVTSLVLAPESLESTFDPLGCLVPSTWAARDTSLDLARWRVVERPRDQADAALEELARWGSRFSVDQITIGLANPDVGPFAQRALAEHGVQARDAAGSPLASSGPAQLLSLTARFLRSHRFDDFATLVRQPAFENALRETLIDVDPVASVDEYFLRHLPSLVDGTWLAAKGDRRDLASQRRLQQLWSASLTLLGDLWDDEAQRITALTNRLRSYLERIYGDAPLQRADESERVTLHALEQLGIALAEVESLPKGFAPPGSAHEAIDVLLRAIQGQVAPPAAARGDAPTLEMLGWFELSLDDAPALLVLGFEDGHVPESVRGDAYLPDRLRRSLGLLDEERRLARDLYATELLLHSRAEVCFISGRRSLDGDPLVPSRIVFHCAQEDAPERVQRFLSGGSASSARIEDQSPRFELPRLEKPFTLETISVTDFKTYLKSPYDFYLRRVLKLQTLDDRARELDPLAFGNVAHEVVERFGRDTKVRESTDPSAIAQFLSGELESVARELYGRHPLPAVRLQLRQLEYRLAAFAEKQAERRNQGWRVLEVEWSPPGGSVPFLVDGEPVQLRGRIDRIDHRPESNEFAVWDYKTGEEVRKPVTAHRAADGTWRDLQLPLYCWLVAELCGEAMPTQVGYIALGRDPHRIEFAKVETWDRKKGEFDSIEDGVESAWEVAKDVVRRIRKGAFFTEEGFEPYDPIFQAIGGVGLVEAGAEDVE